MATMKRHKTDKPGVFYIMATSPTGKPEKVYYIRYRLDGKLIEEKVGRSSRDMTPARAATIRGKRIEGAQLSNQARRESERAAKAAESWTIGKLWTEYKDQRPDSKGLNVDENRFAVYLEGPFGEKAPADLIQLDIDRLRVKLLKTKAPQTVAHVLGLLKRIVNFGADRGLCPGPGFKIKLPRVSNEKTEDLTPKQLEALLTAIEKSTHKTAKTMMLLALFTGMRRGEMFKLKWTDIDFERGFVTLRDPKGGTDQRIPLADEALKLLEAHPRTRSAFVFPGRGGRQLTTIRYPVNAIRDAAGLPASFRALHGLRHVYASMLASSGRVDLYTVQKLLTHKHPRMTQRYAHLADEAMHKAAAVAGAIITDAGKGNEEADQGKVVNLTDRKR